MSMSRQSTRRMMLETMAGAPLASLLPRPAAAAPDGTIRIAPQGGAALVFDLARARDAGAFRGPGFVQHCSALPRDSAMPWLSVCYRPDEGGKRHEVVLELSDAGARQAVDLAGYAVELEIGGRTLLRGAVPRHYWAARWRLQSAPRPRVRTVADLVRAGLVPVYLPGAESGAGKPYQPMGLADVTAYMPTTGERDDIGLFPAWTTAFLASPTETNWQRVLANAEACATFSWHWRDETGQVFNIDRHPDWSIDPRFAPAAKVPAWPAGRDERTDPVVDDAHQPQLTYVPYLLTGDPFLLEELQFQANWHMWSNGSQNGLGLLSDSQVRGLAWTLRQVALAAAATPEQVPPWLLPRDYFLRKLENNRRWLAERTVDSIDPFTQTFHFPWVIDLRGIGSWQEDFISLTLGQIVRMGFTAWRPIHDWACENLVARGNGSSGWPRNVPVWYYVSGVDDAAVAATSWAALAKLNEAKLDPRLDLNYLGTYLAAMRLAASLGHAEMRPFLALYESRMPARFGQKYQISPELAPTVPPQPASAGDSQFRPAIQRLPQRPGNYALAPGAAYVLGSAPAQNVVVASPDHTWEATLHGDGAVGFLNIHDGQTLLVRGIMSVLFDGNSFDVARGQWINPRPRGGH
jgi:hypothetical protein